MEYVQMTLDDWVQMKQKLKQELLGVKQSFVRIGYALRQIDDQKLYEQDGYKSIAEFAQAEYGLGPSITSRFMSINREYSLTDILNSSGRNMQNWAGASWRKC